jgi:hypothetical protein
MALTDACGLSRLGADFQTIFEGRTQNLLEGAVGHSVESTLRARLCTPFGIPRPTRAGFRCRGATRVGAGVQIAFRGP